MGQTPVLRVKQLEKKSKRYVTVLNKISKEIEMWNKRQEFRHNKAPWTSSVFDLKNEILEHHYNRLLEYFQYFSSEKMEPLNYDY